MPVTITITCDGCKQTITSNAYLRADFRPQGLYKGQVPAGVIAFCDAGCISKYVAPTTTTTTTGA